MRASGAVSPASRPGGALLTLLWLPPGTDRPMRECPRSRHGGAMLTAPIRSSRLGPSTILAPHGRSGREEGLNPRENVPAAITSSFDGCLAVRARARTRGRFAMGSDKAARARRAARA